MSYDSIRGCDGMDWGNYYANVNRDRIEKVEQEQKDIMDILKEISKDVKQIKMDLD